MHVFQLFRRKVRNGQITSFCNDEWHLILILLLNILNYMICVIIGSWASFSFRKKSLGELAIMWDELKNDCACVVLNDCDRYVWI